MTPWSKRVTTLAGSALAVAVLSASAVVLAHADDFSSEPVGDAPAASPSVPAGYTGLDDPLLQQCTDQQAVCNPAADAASRSESDLSSPALATTPLLTVGQAIQLAESLHDAPTPAVANARLMDGTAAAALGQFDRSPYIDPTRPVWVVTVNSPVAATTVATGAETVPVYTVYIDAAAATVTDECDGCNTVTS